VREHQIAVAASLPGVLPVPAWAHAVPFGNNNGSTHNEAVHL
jgi:hypothetical protein